MIDTRIVPSFWLSEFTNSDTAARLGLDNTPSPEVLADLRMFLAPGMQRIRECLGQPVNISSGYRSPAVNKAVGGAAVSQHKLGQAADFTCPAFGAPQTIVSYLLKHAADIRFDQLIQEGTWVHVSFALFPRSEVLTAHFGAGGTTYTQGA